MAVNISKGQKVNLKKETPWLKRVLIGLGWDSVEQELPQKEAGFVSSVKSFFGIVSKQSFQSTSPEKPEIDIDVGILGITKKGKCKVLVYYGKLKYHDGAIKHYGDNLTGEGLADQDDEKIEIRLDEIPKKISRLSIIINIYDAYDRGQDFSQVKNCYVYVEDVASGRELVRYDVEGNFRGMTGIFVADLKRCEDTWEFEAKGEGVKVEDIAEMQMMLQN